MDPNKTEAQHQATIDRWRRKIAQNEDLGEAATRGLKSVLKKALKDEQTHKNLAIEFRDSIRGKGSPSKFRGDEAGFNLPGVEDEIITGREPRPWENDDDAY